MLATTSLHLLYALPIPICCWFHTTQVHTTFVSRGFSVAAPRVLNSGRLGVKMPKNFSPDAQFLRRGRHDVQIKRPLIMSICL